MKSLVAASLTLAVVLGAPSLAANAQNPAAPPALESGMQHRPSASAAPAAPGGDTAPAVRSDAAAAPHSHVAKTAHRATPHKVKKRVRHAPKKPVHHKTAKPRTASPKRSAE